MSLIDSVLCSHVWCCSRGLWKCSGKSSCQAKIVFTYAQARLSVLPRWNFHIRRFWCTAINKFFETGMRGKYVRIDSIQSSLDLWRWDRNVGKCQSALTTSPKSEDLTNLNYEYVRMKQRYVPAILERLINPAWFDIAYSWMGSVSMEMFSPLRLSNDNTKSIAVIKDSIV